MPAPKCPKCKEADLFYVQRVYEYHSIQDFELDGDLNLQAIEDSHMDETFFPYLWCEKCCGHYSLETMEPINDPRDISTVRCKFCNDLVPKSTAHAHDGGWVGDECCWDERLRNTE